MSTLPDQAWMLCQGCGVPQPPDPPTDDYPDGRLGGICPECSGPLQRVPVGMAMAAQQAKMEETMRAMQEMQRNAQPQLPQGNQPGTTTVDLGGGSTPEPGTTTVRQTDG